MRYIKTFSIAISLSWLFVILVWSGFTVKTILSNSAKSEWRLDASLKSTIETKILDNIRFKRPLVDLNGGWSRLLGRKYCNKVLRLKNGHLARLIEYYSQEEYARRTDVLSQYCTNNNIEFLFVLFGRKVDQEGHVLPRGCPKDYSWRNSDEFLSLLKDADFLDLRPYTSKTIKDVTDNFFKTDHHWNFKGCMKVFPVIVDKILSKLNCDYSGCIEAVSASNWDVIEVPREFTGSSSQRTGRFFGGTDDFYYFIPTFRTDMMSSYIDEGGLCIHKSGDFDEALLEKRVLGDPVSFLEDAAYNVYRWGRCSLFVHRNRLAPIKKRILIVKDSFAVPIASFLSTVFSEIIVLDLRYLENMILEKYIAAISPDIVCVMYNASSLEPGDTFNFSSRNIENKARELLEKEKVLVVESTARNKCLNIQGLIKSGALIKVSVDSVDLYSEDQALQCAEICLIDRVKGNLVANAYFFPNFPLRQVVTLKSPNEGIYDLLFYAGLRDSYTEGALTLTGLTVEIVE